MVTQADNAVLKPLLKTGWMEHLFPADRLGRADCVLGGATLVACFFLFLQSDLQMIGFCSLSYLSGDPLDFYENAARATDAVGFPTVCGFPPGIYAIFALWLYPLEALGFAFDAEAFPTFQTYLANLGRLPSFQTYWLKILTTAAYIASGVVFYRIARVYWNDDEWAKYATAAWMAMPLAVFSQFIFSQADIFYVLLTLLGILMFLKGRLYLGALYFGLSITFKYFPAFVFLPLLLLFEKRVSRIALSGLIFLVPMALIELAYHRSAQYVALVHNFVEVERVYRVAMDVDFWKIYVLFATFTVLCGVAYFTEQKGGAQLRAAAYIWLVAAIIPFLFIFWHPQWLMFAAPAIALTSVLSRRFGTHATLDLFGMFLFIVGMSLAFPRNIDAAMFREEWLGISVDYSFTMAQLFDWFGDRSAGVFLSGFTGYLILQMVLKFKHVVGDGSIDAPADNLNYGHVRRYFYYGLLTFVLPASVAMFLDGIY